MKSDRWAAAVSHLGVPIGSAILPWVIWQDSESGSLRRQHARQAFSFQLVYLPFHIFFTAWTMFISVTPLVICMGVGVLLEVPQMMRALTGRPPLRLVPIEILKQ